MCGAGIGVTFKGAELSSVRIFEEMVSASGWGSGSAKRRAYGTGSPTHCLVRKGFFD